MPVYSMVLMGLGILLAVIGSILLIVSAFRESIIWGLVLLFAPCGNIIFACCHWSVAKTGFLTSLIGTVIAIGAILTSPSVLDALRDGKQPGKTAQERTQDLSAQIADKRTQLEGLQNTFATLGRDLPAEFQQLEKRRKSLKSGDETAVTKFNEDAAAYQSKNQRHRQAQQEINAAQSELDHLLDERTRAQAKGRTAGASSGGGDKSVVMYTTQQCPACKVAKQYMAQKGIPYREIDVQSSREGMEAFQKLGGRGVPLIIIGDKRMEGFNSRELDAALGRG